LHSKNVCLKARSNVNDIATAVHCRFAYNADKTRSKVEASNNQHKANKYDIEENTDKNCKAYRDYRLQQQSQNSQHKEHSRISTKLSCNNTGL